MKRGKLVAVFLICSLLLIGLASAGLMDSIRSALTGKATSQSTNVSVNVVGVSQTNQTVDNSTLTGGVVPIEDGTTDAPIYVTVCDPDGVNDIDDNSVEVQYLKAGETTRSNDSCLLVGDVDTYCANFSCTVTMYYWDGAGDWNINASANDLGNGTSTWNNDSTFQYNLLKALTIAPDQINWTAISPGQSNAKADNDPTIVNNTGNYDGTLNITGLDLYGLTTTNEIFGTDNFTVGIVDDCAGSGIALANATQVLITSSDTNPGNLSAGGSAGQENLYHCIPAVPTVSSQQYSTDQQGSWIVSY